ncbi:hypothetical protein BOSEA31B_20069 [Hyphomicrobiales bacterium]|nr:hypothetical protein BOSEA31B_20069 [Hyphomicrobiales bacterium]CAH1702559.1 hypothetical protein BOSEA1005_30431 [Hyphomicrobiales bacterium]CAI0346761.1 hypothetical protein BO1005MUT1_520273 [Hyphomicrobiales bacterium]
MGQRNSSAWAIAQHERTGVATDARAKLSNSGGSIDDPEMKKAKPPIGVRRGLRLDLQSVGSLGASGAPVIRTVSTMPRRAVRIGQRGE